MKTKVSALQNGLPVIYNPMPNMETVGVVFAVDYGSIYETRESNGCAHFLEHMLYRGTDRWKTGADVKNAFAYLCGSGNFNGMTGKEIMLYLGKVHKSMFSDLSDLLSNIITSSRLDPEDVEIERGAIVNENLMKKDNTVKSARWAIDETLFQGHPAGLRTIGDDNSIQNLITADMVKRTYREYFTPDNSVLVIYGAVPEKEILESAENYFGKLSGKFAGRTIEPVSPDNMSNEVVVKKTGLNQAMVARALKLPVYSAKTKIELAAVDILAKVLERNLYAKIREERGMAYSLGVSNDNGRNYSCILSLVGTQPENVDTVKKILSDEMTSLSNGEFSIESADKIKKQTIIENKINLAEKTMESAIQTAFNYVITKDPFFTEETPEMYGSLTLDSLRGACKYFNPERSLSLVIM